VITDTENIHGIMIMGPISNFSVENQGNGEYIFQTTAAGHQH
jgi:hypothetical protein